MAKKGKDYSKIAREKITRPSKIKRLPKILVYSRNKKGKTTFALSAPNVLIMDPEQGTNEMKTKDPHIWPVREWEEVQDFYGFVRSGELCPMEECQSSPHPFRWLGIDGMTKLHKLALHFVMKVEEERNLDRQPGFVQQKDYGKANELLRQMLDNFHNLPHGVVYTTQERMLVEGEFSDEDEDIEAPQVQYVPDLPKGIRSEGNAIVDVIGRLYIVKTEVKGKEVLQRRLWLAPSDVYDTGYRSDYELPATLRNPTVPRLMRLIRTGSAKRG